MRQFILFTVVTAMFGLFGTGTGQAQDSEGGALPENAKTAVFAGGCFWCMEPPFDKMEGVYKTVSGYAGGDVDNPSYKQVSSGRTGHYEVLQVTYDPDKVSYEDLLAVFWRNIDPFDAGGQFCDRGGQYRAAVFAATEEERAAAAKSKKAMEDKLGRDIVTEILPGAEFYPAEYYHQDYYQKNPIRYKFYRGRCGRDDRLADVWGDEAGGRF